MIVEVEQLFERQARQWPRLAKGLEGLARARTRTVRIEWFDVFVRCIPHRIASTTAAIDRASLAKRPCFLCAENLPPEEDGVRFDDELTIYCNPFPVVDRHLTIAHRQHCLQSIANHLGKMLDLAAALPGYFVIYNGPECGASAPDHMHFQAGSRRLFPIQNDIAQSRGGTIPNYRRNALLFRCRDRSELIGRIDRAIGLLARKTGKLPEPLLNLAAFREKGEWVAFLFPRAKHRPEAFYTGELTVSPATIDLCGVFVTPVEEDLDKITADVIAGIFREVTLPDDQFREIAERLERER